MWMYYKLRKNSSQNVGLEYIIALSLHIIHLPLKPFDFMGVRCSIDRSCV